MYDPGRRKAGSGKGEEATSNSSDLGDSQVIIDYLTVW
jgi:hypothetical protein